MTTPPPSIVLVVNCGSSSLKFAVQDVANPIPLMSGLAERLGGEGPVVTFKLNGQKRTDKLPANDHGTALDAILAELDKHGYLSSLVAVGHRIVHGGNITAAKLVTKEVVDYIEEISVLAPLQNPPAVMGLRVATQRLPDVPHVVVVDTAFHQTMQPEAYLYALPYEYYEKNAIRRYGFHGTSHHFVSQEAIRTLGLDPKDSGVVVLHLGSGSSASAVLNGECRDTSMGLTPLEGLVMGTRTGDIDAAAVLHIMRNDGLDVDQMNTLLNKKSGLLGLSGISADCREIEAAAKAGNERAKVALEVFAHRVARYVGALAASLKRLDAVVFTGGIGENSATLRAMIMERVGVFGLKLDAEANSQIFGGKSGVISPAGVKPIAAVIPTNEEWMIAHDTLEIATSARKA